MKLFKELSSKGVIHVLEALLVALVLIVTLPFLLFPVERQTTWDVARLTTVGEDVLATLSGAFYGNDNESLAQDILEENATTLDSLLQRIIGSPSIGYGIRVVGSLKNEVRVGCNCTEEEARTLEFSLTPTYVNGRRIIFFVFPYNLDRWRTLDYDVVIVNGSAPASRLNNFYTASRDGREIVLDHLRKKHGLVEIVDLTAADLDTPLQKDVFGLASSVAGAGGNVNFANVNNVSKLSYAIGKYFYGVGTNLNFTGVIEKNLTLRTLGHRVRKNESSGTWRAVDIDLDRNGTYDPPYELNITEGQQFNVTLDGVIYNMTVDRIDNSSNEVHFNFLRGPGEYNFSDFVGSDPVPVVPRDGNRDRVVATAAGGRDAVIARTFEGGRTVWVSGRGSGDDYRGLLKASVLWAAGEDWNILPRSVSGRQIKVSSYVVQGEDFLEPYWLEMTLWFLF